LCSLFRSMLSMQLGVISMQLSMIIDASDIKSLCLC